MSVEDTRLPSGLVVVTDAMPHLQTASLGCWVACGSRNEHPDEHGISHFLEHMAFKGTSRRSARQIAEEIEAVGGDLNAGTGVETTAYYARVLKADIGLGLDVLSDILTHPSFDPDEVTREKNVIVQEIGIGRFIGVWASLGAGAGVIAIKLLLRPLGARRVDLAIIVALSLLRIAEQIIG